MDKRSFKLVAISVHIWLCFCVDSRLCMCVHACVRGCLCCHGLLAGYVLAVCDCWLYVDS